MGSVSKSMDMLSKKQPSTRYMAQMMSKNCMADRSSP